MTYELHIFPSRFLPAFLGSASNEFTSSKTNAIRPRTLVILTGFFSSRFRKSRGKINHSPRRELMATSRPRE